MTHSQRIVVNTIAQYTRTFINVCLSLYSTRLILAALGQTDFGIFSVVAGVVAMLGFMTNALVTTTQRYISYYHGSGDKDKEHKVFGNSVLLHLLIAGTLVVILAALANPILSHFLHVEPDRLHAAYWVYVSTVLILCLSFMTAPFRAVFIARENIVYISVIDVLEGVLRLLTAIFLTYIVSYDKLITYSGFLVGISCFTFFAFLIYSLLHYEECHVPRLREWDLKYIHSLSGFAGWTMYSAGCILARTQGIAILLNRFFGSALNAAYGIALQVNGATAFLAQSIANAMSPQIIKSAGQGDQANVILLSESASKYAVTLYSLVVIPLIAEMDKVLEIWLGSYHPYTTVFCQFILISCIFDLLTMGLTIANQATGQIKYFSLLINTVKLLTLPAAWLCLHYGLDAVSVMWCFCAFECICAMIRLPYIKYEQGLSIRHYFKTVIFPAAVPIILSTVFCWLMVHYVESTYRIIWTIAGSCALYLPCSYFIVLNKHEKEILKKMIFRKSE